MRSLADAVEHGLAELAPVGRCARTGGYHRLAWTPADLACREWFTAAAGERGLEMEADRNGNLWAWWGQPRAGAVATGSHLDSVRDGGPLDGPLGVLAGLLAVDVLRERGLRPTRPLAVVAFADEEGARFDLACVGSRLLTGALDPDAARASRDDHGVSMAEAMAAAGHDPRGRGAEPDRLAGLAAIVELHVEQGRRLAPLGRPVGVAEGIWPHGRWRVRLPGEANHAGTTPLSERRDPMLELAELVTTARAAALRHQGVATVGKLRVLPNSTNAIPAEVLAWLDARAPAPDALRALVDEVTAGRDAAQLSLTAAVRFDAALTDLLAEATGGPRLATAAGHDAGVLAAGAPAGMLFVRNPTGVSHSPAEAAETADCVAGVLALADVLERLL